MCLGYFWHILLKLLIETAFINFIHIFNFVDIRAVSESNLGHTRTHIPWQITYEADKRCFLKVVFCC
jgi:hypothetical protein